MKKLTPRVLLEGKEMDFIDGALRTIDTSFGNMTSGSWYGYISKEMYGGETQVRSKPEWVNPFS